MKLRCTRVSAKLMPPILLCWPMMSEADVGDMAVVNLPVIIPLNFVAI